MFGTPPRVFPSRKRRRKGLATRSSVSLRKPAIVVQVKYTNQMCRSQERRGIVCFLVRKKEGCEPAVFVFGPPFGRALLFLDQIKREKGVWWMPWQQEAMKDVIPCDKLWGAGNRL